MKKVLLWDFDGTLVHVNKSFLYSLKRTLASHSYALEKNVLDKFLSNTSTWFRPEISYVGRTGRLWWEDYFEKIKSFCSANGIGSDEAETICREFYDGVLNYEYTPYSDARDVLEYSSGRGYANYILSNNFPELPQALERFGLAQYFAGYFLSSCIGYEKPRIELFRYAVSAAGNPGICYMIGDNPTADIEGGKKAGLKTILVHGGQRNEYTDYCCAELTDIKNVI